MLRLRPNSYANPTSIDFQDAAEVPADIQQAIEKQSWSLKEYKELQTVLDTCLEKELIQKEDIDWFPQELAALCRHLSIRRQAITDTELENKIGTYLWQTIASEYQRQGVRFLVTRRGRGLVADEPGLGKTLQAIMTMLFYGWSCWPVVVVCPSLPKLTWELEFRQWLLLPYFHNCTPKIARLINDYLNFVHTLQTSKKIPTVAQSKNHWITIVSYDLLRNEDVYKYVTDTFKPKMMVVDECHYVKHEKAKRTKAVTNLAETCQHVLFLSGTPLSRCQDLYAQLHCLYPKFFPKFFYSSFKQYKKIENATNGPHRKAFYFAEYFCQGVYRQQRLRNGGAKIWVPSTGGISRQDVLHQILAEHILIQRTQKQVLSDQLLPVERIRYIMPYQKQPDDNNHVDGKDRKKDDVQLKYQLFELYNQLAGIKARMVPIFMQYYLSLYKDAVDGIPKTLIWAHHYEVLDAVQDFCKANDIGYIRIDGSVPYPERVKMVELFKEEKKIQVAILSLMACNTSLNLQVANVNIFFQLHWDIFQMQQAENRCNRRGQTKQVRSFYVLAQDTLDKMLWQLNTRAYKNATMLTQGAEERFLAAFKHFQANPNNQDDDDQEEKD